MWACTVPGSTQWWGLSLHNAHHKQWRSILGVPAAAVLIHH
jgi:hypothetical protein